MKFPQTQISDRATRRAPISDQKPDPGLQNGFDSWLSEYQQRLGRVVEACRVDNSKSQAALMASDDDAGEGPPSR